MVLANAVNAWDSVLATVSEACAYYYKNVLIVSNKMDFVASFVNVKRNREERKLNWKSLKKRSRQKGISTKKKMTKQDKRLYYNRIRSKNWWLKLMFWQKKNLSDLRELGFIPKTSSTKTS
jgi:hypothetical protein